MTDPAAIPPAAPAKMLSRTQQRKQQKQQKENKVIAKELEKLRRFVEGTARTFDFVGCSGRCRFALHRTCERLGLGHLSHDVNARCELTGERYVSTVLVVSRPAGWSMGTMSFDDAREDLHPTPLTEPRPRRKRYECECCGKGDDEVQIALTRVWGLACINCIDDSSMSRMVGEDITAYKIEDVPRDYSRGRRGAPTLVPRDGRLPTLGADVAPRE
uniref:R3H domain-containing protein n=1 Tax=Diacronema lutheri TaxID=2081491 RepID=A0A7R9UQ96_DIALT|mmetsp:Transcript_20200/g.62814  ORF Transcript_20200/g.62814 Transcript_20200/m.62814 type:complete len:216 (+) Transcript_20200:1-648(+)